MQRSRSLRSSRVLLGISLATALVSVSACSSSTTEAETAPEWLFTQTASSATYTPNDDGTATLVLEGAAPHTTAFTDRPVREAHLLSTPAFVATWGEMFGDTPPNATLVEAEAMDSPDVLELLDVSLADGGRDLVYTVKPVALEGEQVTPEPFSTE